MSGIIIVSLIIALAVLSGRLSEKPNPEMTIIEQDQDPQLLSAGR